MRRLFIFAFLLAAAVSCLEGPDCINRKNDLVGVSFKSMNTLADTSQIIDSINVAGAVLAFEAPGEASKLVLPIDYFNDSTFYILEIDDTVYNLTLTYDVEVQYIADDCGERFTLSNLQVPEHGFDSVSVTNATPGKDNAATNIQIFR